MLSPDWLDAVTEIVSRETRHAYRHLGLNTCVSSSRVLYTVLRQQGIRSEPTAVSAMSLNDVSFDDIKNGRPLSGFMYYVGPDMAGIPPDRSVKVLSGEAWNAHMVLAIRPSPDSDLFIADVTAPQFSRPQYGVTVPSAVTFDAEPAAWLAGEPGGVELPGGGGLIYRRLSDDVPESQTWKTSSAWTKEGSTVRGIADRCTRQLMRLDEPRVLSH